MINNYIMQLELSYIKRKKFFENIFEFTIKWVKKFFSSKVYSEQEKVCDLLLHTTEFQIFKTFGMIMSPQKITKEIIRFQSLTS